ncbi:MAG: VanZ family protein [Planctomycetota bacterium]|nr:VanZ family protein [Planctomycetota bacterium]
MTLSRRQKITALLLAIYWPALFIFAHISVPRVVREADVSDKSLHFIAFLILVFLLWFTVSDGRKVNWRIAAPWCVLLTMGVYGILDEWLQSYVAGRSCDAWDFFADMTSTLTGLIMFSVLSFWPAGLLVTAIVIFGIANISQVDLSDLMPAANTVFHLGAYALFTAFWIQCLHLFLPTISLRATRTGWLAAAFAAPVGLVLTVKLSSLVLGSEFSVPDMIISFGSIAVTVATVYLSASYHKRERKNPGS